MNFSRAASVLSFFGALAIGVTVVWALNVWNDGAKILDGRYAATSTGETVSCRFKHAETAPVRVAATDLVGRWRGTFGYGDKEAMIYIDRVEGNKFYGNLTVHGALIALEGTVNSNRQEISFRETKVLSIDKSLGRWSLGKDSGAYSTDGKEMYGIGRDEYGTYEWSMTKDN